MARKPKNVEEIHLRSATIVHLAAAVRQRFWAYQKEEERNA